ncbi:MAG: sugar-binding protein [bacterium]|nr:sugar-binding protein [bacterium]
MKKRVWIFSLALLALSVSAGAQDFSITIDGQKDAWYGQLTGPANGVVYLPSDAYLRDVGVPPDDNADVSATVWFSYDAEYLYCYAEVNDDVVAATNGSRFENDCVELKFDPDPAAGAGTATSNSRFTARGAADAENPAGVDNLNGSGHLEDASGSDWIPSDEDYARRITADGYAVEFRIPFDYINEPQDGRFMVARDVNAVFGLAINVGDNDAASRESMLQWSAGHHNDAHSNAALLGSATFLDNHMLRLEAVSPRDNSIVNENADEWYLLPTGVDDASVSPPGTFELLSNYPNPFNPSTRILYRSDRVEPVTLDVFSLTGGRVRRLVDGVPAAPGVHEAVWNGLNDAGETAASGTYIVRLTSPSRAASARITLVK